MRVRVGVFYWISIRLVSDVDNISLIKGKDENGLMEGVIAALTTQSSREAVVVALCRSSN